MKIGIIGRGMIGASAARHLSQTPHDITLIGPVEPENRASHDGVFGSHYDEGRITRLLDPHPVWEALAAASIDRYAQIEAQTGISFFREVGLLIGAPDGSDYLANLRKVRDQTHSPSQEYRGAALKRAFPYLGFDDDMVMLHQPSRAGHISPRRLVAAQTKAAGQNGATILDQTARQITGNTVHTDAQTFEFDRILIACGAFTNALLQRPLALRPLARTITFFELDRAEAARLNAMPSTIFRVADGSDPYVLPPITYPNGKTYIKIGGEPAARVLQNAQEAKTWFRSGGDPALGRYMTARIEALIPGIRYKSVHTESCAVTYTTTGLPYIGAVNDCVTVAAGGCGAAAKSCDEIGRIAGLATLGHTDPRFEIRFQDEVPDET